MSENTSTGLPVDAIRSPFEDALAASDVVVTAATGSGKSTRLPVWAAATGYRVLVIQPRRLAATSLAGFVAASLGESLGEGIGYAVRFDQRYSPGDRIVFVTPGMALQWFTADGLCGFDAVVLDEFHERRWDTDLLLALLRGRAHHRLVLTSATLPGPDLAHWLDALHLEAEGRAYPVTVEYQSGEPRTMPSSDKLAERVSSAVERGEAVGQGHILVFLPGRGEIRGVAERLDTAGREVVELHASASASQQRRALEEGGSRRVILATNVAETSLTVPGVDVVIDSGLQRRTARRNGRTVLALAPVSQANADQRKGRAGRLAPGHCIRLWGERAPLDRSSPPEIAREELTELVLAAGVAGQPVRGLNFPDPPPSASLTAAEERLVAIGAIDNQGYATDRGARLFQLPIDTWLAHLIVAMPDADTAGMMADLAAALQPGAWITPARDQAERAALDEWLNPGCDASLRVAGLRLGEFSGARVSRSGLDEARRLADRLRAAMGLTGTPSTFDAGTMQRALEAAAAALPEAVFVRRHKRRHAMGNGVGEVVIGEASRLRDADEAALVLDDHSVPGKGTRDTVTIATCLARLSMSALVASGVATERLSSPAWDGERLTAQRVHDYAGRTIGEPEIVEPEGTALRHAAAECILDNGLCAPAGTRLRDDLEAWALYVALNGLDDTIPEALDWLAGRLAELGVATSEDLALIEPTDLQFRGIPEWERERFDRYYPRWVSLTDLELAVHYDVRRRTVTVEKRAGRRRRDPQRWELPAWSGWRVMFQSASRVVEVR
jgi:HrpA-like RNA helicase